MENKTRNQLKDYAISASILVSALILAGAWIYTEGFNFPNFPQKGNTAALEESRESRLEEKVLPTEGVILPVVWGDLGTKLVDVGVIDEDKLKSIYKKRGAFSDEYKNLLLGQNNGKLKITKENAGYLLNLFWALGLANKNPILDSGEMANPAYGGGSPPAGGFASTGGWTIAKGPSTGSGHVDPMNHYSRHKFFNLTDKEQALVDKVSRGIYRPCCNNSTHFPDCNHGMAMLGLLELMASQGVSEKDMWQTALTVNSYWFSDTYLTIATYMKNKGVGWKNVNPEEILGADYSSASGYARIASQVTAPSGSQGGSGSGCGVDTGQTVAPQRQQSGCGI